MQHTGSSSFNQLDRLGRVMKLDVVEQDDVARAQAGDKQVLDVQRKDLRVDCPCNRHRRKDPAQREGADDRNAPAISAGLSHHGSFPPWRPGMGARHRRMDGKFIHKHQVGRGQARLFGRKVRPRYRVRFTRPTGLFFLVRAKASSQRQTVLTLTLTRFLFLIPARSSASVASGCSATRAASTPRSSLSSLALAPPPCGNGARSLVLRRCRSSLYTYEECT